MQLFLYRISDWIFFKKDFPDTLHWLFSVDSEWMKVKSAAVFRSFYEHSFAFYFLYKICEHHVKEQWKQVGRYMHIAQLNKILLFKIFHGSAFVWFSIHLYLLDAIFWWATHTLHIYKYFYTFKRNECICKVTKSDKIHYLVSKI